MPRQSSRPVAFLYSLVPLAVAASVLLALIVVGGRAVQGYEMRQEARALELRVDSLKKENRLLSQSLDYYRGDQYIEKVAREELGLVRPNDVAVIIVPADGTGSIPILPVPALASVPTPAVPGQEVPPWQRWLSLFVGRD